MSPTEPTSQASTQAGRTAKRGAWTHGASLPGRDLTGWAHRADDVLWRRSMLGLHLRATQRTAEATRCATHYPGAAASTTASRVTEPAWN